MQNGQNFTCFLHAFSHMFFTCLSRGNDNYMWIGVRILRNINTALKYWITRNHATLYLSLCGSILRCGNGFVGYRCTQRLGKLQSIAKWQKKLFSFEVTCRPLWSKQEMYLKLTDFWIIKIFSFQKKQSMVKCSKILFNRSRTWKLFRVVRVYRLQQNVWRWTETPQAHLY